MKLDILIVELTLCVYEMLFPKLRYRMFCGLAKIWHQAREYYY